jgi:putative ABC transport system ATP-binding protein
MRQHLVELDNLRFSWTAEEPLIDLAHWRLDEGEQVLVSGPSGCGKSTLLALLCGLLMPSSGSIRFLGTNLPGLNEAARDRIRCDHIGVIFQQFNLVPYLSALDNMVLGCRLSSRRRKKFASLAQISEAARAMAAALDLGPSELRRPVGKLSIGQQQRVAAVRALLGSPELLLADEPTSALDPERERQFLALLGKQCRQQQTAVLMVSHREELAAQFDRHWQLAIPAAQEY